MSTPSGKTFVGFGFGPIQSGLFLYEAYKSGNFTRFVVAEVDKPLVAALGNNHGRYTVNIARKDGIDRCELRGIEMYDPQVPAGREAIVAAIAESHEMATCLPSVRFYDLGGDTSVAGMIADGLARRPAPVATIIYASENNNHAAAMLTEAIRRHVPPEKLDSVCPVDTVIGKMSGVITDPREIRDIGLTTITPDIGRAILVEEFNRILISSVAMSGFRRGIDVFIEKDDLLPFEEAKLYGHNAIHATIAYLADVKGYDTIADAGRDDQIMAVARRAFIDESGAALIKRHRALGDELFTPDGYREYADDLLDRMTRKNLNDLVVRVGRDHARKLGYDDRIYGTMRLALDNGVSPKNLAAGAAAGVISMIRRRDSIDPPIDLLPTGPADLSRELLAKLLGHLWADKVDDNAPELISLTWDALTELQINRLR